MPLISTLESRFGHFAIPGLVQFVAILQFVTFVLGWIIDKEAAGIFLNALNLTPQWLLNGQVWRVVTHILMPVSFSPLWAIIGVMFLVWVGRGLDEAMGAFRVNLYLLSGLILLAIGSLIFGYSGGGVWLMQTLLFAFAMFYPDKEILLYFVIPIKVKWMAWLGAAVMAFFVLKQPASFWQVLAANANFLIAFGPGMIQRGANRLKVLERRNRFESAKATDFFHQCHVCGKTEVDDPSLEFRVTAIGDEICQLCRDSGRSAPSHGGEGSGGSDS